MESPYVSLQFLPGAWVPARRTQGKWQDARNEAPYANRVPAALCAQVYKDNPPCNTLYVGNLSSSVNEAEVQQVFNT